MPINRTYMCPECSHRMEVVLSTEQWDAPPPSCDACDAREMRQEFYPPAIGGSVGSRARKLTEDIITNDYGVADVKFDRRGGPPNVRYKDQASTTLQSTWGGQVANALETAVSIGKQTRRENGGFDGLDMLKSQLASGAQPDLIAASKRRAIKVW